MPDLTQRSRWIILNNRGKGKHIFYSGLLILGTGFLFLILDFLIDYGFEFSLYSVNKYNLLIRISGFFMIGIILGYLDWNYTKKCNSEKITEKQRKYYYIFTYGIMGWGLVMSFNSLITTENTLNFITFLVKGIIWFIGGYFFGLVLYSSAKNKNLNT